MVRIVFADGGTIHTFAGRAVTVLWLYWGVDEILRGVNPFRRALGSFAVLSTVVGLLA